MGCAEGSTNKGPLSDGPLAPGGFMYVTEALQTKSTALNLQRTKTNAGKIVQKIDLSRKLTQIVPSPQAQEAQSCLDSGRQFRDSVFPPTTRSLNQGS